MFTNKHGDWVTRCTGMFDSIALQLYFQLFLQNLHLSKKLYSIKLSKCQTGSLTPMSIEYFFRA